METKNGIFIDEYEKEKCNATDNVAGDQIKKACGTYYHTIPYVLASLVFRLFPSQRHPKRPADWNGAEWIGGFTQARASFALRAGATVVGATAYASGLGCFALTLNGQQVADSMMDPGWSTLPPMRLLYRAYNVSHLLVPGENSAGVRLGFCHYGGIDQPFCIDGHAMRDTCRGFVMRLSVRYADGETQDVLTTARGGGGVQWNGTTKGNPMVYTHLYHGEVFDARILQAGWDEPGFSVTTDAGWGSVLPYSGTTAYEGPNQPGASCSWGSLLRSLRRRRRFHPARASSGRSLLARAAGGRAAAASATRAAQWTLRGGIRRVVAAFAARPHRTAAASPASAASTASAVTADQHLRAFTRPTARWSKSPTGTTSASSSQTRQRSRPSQSARRHASNTRPACKLLGHHRMPTSA